MLDALVLDLSGGLAQGSTVSQATGPHFRADGPNADEFGRKEGYPSCKGPAYIDETRCRVGALSRYDTLFPARTITARSNQSNWLVQRANLSLVIASRGPT
jgi:hypothetical protein